MIQFLRRLFGSSEKTSERPTSVFHYMRPGQPQSWPRNYNEFSKQGYQKNVVAYRCISMISQGVGALEWEVFKRSGKRRVELEDHPLVDLLYRPNTLLSKATFFEAIVAYRLISGNSYILKVSPSSQSPSSKPPTELWPLRPDLIRILSGAKSLPMGYLYGQQDSAIRYPVDQVTGDSDILHLKNFHPTDPWYGMSPIEAAALQIDLHNEASTWNTALLKNGARPSGALIMTATDANPTASMGDDQYRQLKEEIDHGYSGPRKAGRPLILQGGLDWKEMSLSPKDMDWLNSKQTSAREVALAFGVPPMLLGIPGDNTYSNYKEARQALYEETILPIALSTADYLNHGICPLFGEGLEIQPDKDEIDALAPKRDAAWDRIDKATFLTINEKRVKLGEQEIEDGDVILVPTSMTTLEELRDQAESGEVEGIEPVSNDNSEEDDTVEGDEEDEGAQEENDGKSVKLFNLTTSRDKKKEWQTQQKMMSSARAQMRRECSAQFKVEGTRMVHMLKDASSEAHAVAIVSREVEAHKKSWEAIATKNETAIGYKFGKRVLNTLKSNRKTKAEDSDSDMTDFERIHREWIKNHVGEMITGLEKTTKDRVVKQIRKHYAEAAEEGEGAVPLAERIKDTYEEFSKSRAMLIARTEIAAASQAASLGAAKSLGLPGIEKEWVSTDDDRTRDDHGEANGQRVAMDDPFDIGGHPMHHPGDPAGPPEEVCNCRCAMIFHRSEGEE